MKDETVVKLTTIICLTIVLIVNFFTMKIDSTFTGTVCAIMGGIAGYELGRRKNSKGQKLDTEENELLSSDDEKEIEALARSYVDKWVASLRAKGKQPTSEGIKRYYETAKRMARIRVSMSSADEG